jgi:predicted kinase/histidinol phosphatase-like enzyme
MGNHTRKLVVLVGESGSGKSTLARKLVAKGYVRLNRDELRIENAAHTRSLKGGSGGYAAENFIGELQDRLAREALEADKNVVIDDTNLNPGKVEHWRNIANHLSAFELVRLSVDLQTCIDRDALRTGTAHVGRPVIERQFLYSKRLIIDPDKKIVLCDVDGTLASHMDENGKWLRSPYAENVEVDRPWQPVIDEINRLYDAGYLIFIVSGRKSTCGEATVAWLIQHGVKFHHVFMRHKHDNDSDVKVKNTILNELLQSVEMERIAFVIDDRPRVVKDAWMARGIPVRPVYGGKFLTPEEFTTEHKEGCSYDREDLSDYRRCPECGALEDF